MTRLPLRAAQVARTTAAFALVLVASFAIALGTGPSETGPAAVWRAFFGAGASGPEADIVLRIRLPRALLGATVGAALSVAGLVFQALLRNPLADPFVLGVSGGAALAGVAVLALGGAAGFGTMLVPPAAFAGAIAALLLLFAAAGPRGRLAPGVLLLTGVVFNAFASAAIIFLASAAGLADGARVFLWLIGSLASAPTGLSLLSAGVVACGIACVFPFARRLDLLALGEETAAQLGVDVDRLRVGLLVATSLLVGVAVSLSGLIGFVGLIVPHALRLSLGPDHRLLVPASALGGAAFLVLCDTAARSLLGGREIPVGAITALAGGPLCLWLLRRAPGRGLLP